MAKLDPGSALAGALIDDDDVEEKLRVQLKGVETRAELLRKAPASVAIRLLRDGDRAGAAEAVDAGFEQVAEALASLSQGSAVGEVRRRFKHIGRRRRRRAAPIQRCWRKVAHLPRSRPRTLHAHLGSRRYVREKY